MKRPMKNLGALSAALVVFPLIAAEPAATAVETFPALIAATMIDCQI